ncbi:MAG: hypothetical protein ACK5KR_08950 [Breznakia sp.]
MGKIKFYTGALKKLDRNVVVSLEQTGEEVMTRVRNSGTMPFDTGAMQNEQTFVDDSQSSKGLVSIVTTSPQARRLYFHPEYDFQKINNANAGAEWFDDYAKGGRKVNDVQKIFSQFLKRNVGG